MADNPLLFYASIVLFAVISWAIYKYVLTANNNYATTAAAGPEPSSSTTATATASATGGTSTSAATNNTTNATAAATTNSSTKEETSSSPYNNFDQPKRHPPHLYNPSNKKLILHPSKVENGGIIPFKLTFASGYETRLSNNTNNKGVVEEHNENLIITNRKQRARLFAKLFTISDRPPNRGSNVVVIISYGSAGNDVVAKCDKLQKSLMLLGTYYNLFLLVDYSQHQQKKEELDRNVVKQFRNDLLNVTKEDDGGESSSLSLPTTTTATATADKLNPQILPPHRIIFTTTPEGKIAFVRQLHEVKLVLLGSSSNNKEEEEEEDNNNNKVKVELERFGFRVVSYPENNNWDGGDGGEGVSALGQFLIP